ncbi:hypothetical protein FACS189499_03800 [Clostridia bacterium]|nr:hypothetical protein FACS189499_03800 [Clostridia bacterium]
MALTDAQKRATREYDKKNFSQLKLMPRKDEAEFIRKSAEEHGESLTGYLVNCAMLREGRPLTVRKPIPAVKKVDDEKSKAKVDDEKSNAKVDEGE